MSEKRTRATTHWEKAMSVDNNSKKTMPIDVDRYIELMEKKNKNFWQDIADAYETALNILLSQPSKGFDFEHSEVNEND